MFEDVSFAYPARPDAEVLDRLTLHVCAGTTQAIVGGSGRQAIASSAMRHAAQWEEHARLAAAAVLRSAARTGAA